MVTNTAVICVNVPMPLPQVNTTPSVRGTSMIRGPHTPWPTTASRAVIIMIDTAVVTIAASQPASLVSFQGPATVRHWATQTRISAFLMAFSDRDTTEDT